MPHLFHSAPHQNRYYAWFEALHTRVDLLLLGSHSEAEFETVEAAMRAELSAVEKLGNRFDPDSELSRAVRAANASLSFSLNNSPAPGSVVGGSPADFAPVPISPALYSLLARCLQANRDTDGLFDITVNSPDFYPGLINSITLLEDPSKSPDQGRLAFQLENYAQPLPSPMGEGAGVRLGRAGGEFSSIILDLSGILKGYALERLRTLLHTLGITDALINLGNSSILSLGHNPSDIPPNHCLTTSGNATAERCHIRNPLTGKFVTGQREVSITTADAIDGEILATVTSLRNCEN